MVVFKFEHLLYVVLRGRHLKLDASERWETVAVFFKMIRMLVELLISG